MKSSKKSLRSQIGQYTGKICSYVELGRLDEARQWATILQQKLIELNLLVDNTKRPVHNGPQPENVTTASGTNTK